MTDDAADDRDLEQWLREALQERYSDDFLRLVLAAERRMCERKDALIDLLQVNVLNAQEYADKVDDVVHVFLREVVGIVGLNACKAVFEFGPDDEIRLVDASQIAVGVQRSDALAIARLIVTEVSFAADQLHRLKDEESIRRGLLELIRTTTTEADVNEYVGGGTRKAVLSWRAATLCRYLISVYGGDAADDLAWRIAAGILALDGLYLDPDTNVRSEFVSALREEQPSALEDWLLDHAKDKPRKSLVDLFKPVD